MHGSGGWVCWFAESNLGNPLSINQLTNQIKNHYGAAYYANTYQKLQNLKNNDLVKLEPIGHSSSIKLNFESYLLVDTLSDMEKEKKLHLLSKKENLFQFFCEMDKSLSSQAYTKSLSAINPAKTLKLNRIDLLTLLNQAPDYLNQTIKLQKATMNLQKKYNLKINNLILNKHTFSNLLSSDEINPAREALSQQITLYNPQAFWSQIKETAQKNQIRTLQTETKPLNIPDSDLNFNLNRFGYGEFGTAIVEG